MSIDTGQTWTAVNDGLPDSMNVCTSISSGGGYVYASFTYDGIYRLSAGDTTWTYMTSGNTYIVDANDSYVISGAPNGVSISNNNGTSWTASNDRTK